MEGSGGFSCAVNISCLSSLDYIFTLLLLDSVYLSDW